MCGVNGNTSCPKAQPAYLRAAGRLPLSGGATARKLSPLHQRSRRQKRPMEGAAGMTPMLPLMPSARPNRQSNGLRPRERMAYVVLEAAVSDLNFVLSGV